MEGGKSSARRGPVARVCEQGPLRESVLERLEGRVASDSRCQRRVGGWLVQGAAVRPSVTGAEQCASEDDSQWTTTATTEVEVRQYGGLGLK